MSEETRSHSPLDQAEELWKQWYETSSKVWTDVLEGAKESYVDPYGLYSSWLKTIEESQGAGTSGFASTLNPQEIWKKWFEMTGEIWHKSQEIGTNPLGMTTRWFEVMEEIRQKLLDGATISADPLTFFKQWYESSNEVWSKAIEEVIGTEKFVEATNRYVESYTTFYKAFRRLNEDYFSKLQLTTRADLAHVAEIIIALENKVDWVQDAFEDFQGQFPQFATLESIRLLGNHLENLESKLQKLPEALEKIDMLEDLGHRLDGIEGKLNEIPLALQKIDAIQGLDQRLGAVEWRLGEIPPRLDAIQGLDQRISGVEDRLSELPGALEKVNAIGGLEKRLDGVENKLDKLLTLLEQIGTRQPATTAPARTSQRRASKAKTAPHQETPETESEGTPS
jgi:polyhydroxyalkanoic acid synthase PhaR subunit